MPFVVNNSARVITIIDVVLVPAEPKEVPEEYMDRIQHLIDAGDLELRKPDPVQPPPPQDEQPQPKPRTKAEMMHDFTPMEE